MSDFNRLTRLLEDELHRQEILLDLLGRERVAIVGLKQEQIDSFRRRKEEVIAEAQEVAQKRDEVLISILGPRQPGNPPKFTEVLEHCPTADMRSKLEKMGKELKLTAAAVQELNAQNAELIKHSLGLVVSTISIFRGMPGAELPAYNQSGALKGVEASPYSQKRSSLVRDA